MLGRILTAVIGVVAKGPNAKARAGVISGSLIAAVSNLDQFGDAFWTGLIAGSAPQLEQLGFFVGATLIGGLVGRIIVWFSPPNKDA